MKTFYLMCDAELVLYKKMYRPSAVVVDFTYTLCKMSKSQHLHIFLPLK